MALFIQQKKDLVEVLLSQGMLNDLQVKEINAESLRLKKPKEEIIEEKGLVSEDDLALAFSIAFDLPIIQLPDEPIPFDVLFSIPKEKAEQFKVIPFEKAGKDLKIGIADPFRFLKKQFEFQEFLVSNHIQPLFYIISATDFKKALFQYDRELALSIRQKEFPTISLEGLEIPYEIITKIPEQIARKYKILVFGAVPDKMLKIAISDPKDIRVLEILDFIKKRTGFKLEVYVTTPEDLERAFQAYQRPLLPAPSPQPSILPQKEVIEEKEEKPLITIEKVITAPKTEIPETQLLKKDVTQLSDLEKIVKAGYIPKIVAAIINFACQKRATDIHIQPLEKELLVRYRIDGLLRDIIHIPIEYHPAIISRIKILSSLKIDEQRIPQDGRFEVNFHNHSVDIRVSTLPTANGEKAVLRLLDKSMGLLTLEQIGLEGEAKKRLIKEIEKPYGIILATGPTGSGKTTTLYAILNRIKNPTVNIVTLEDPVEYKIDGVNQSQIRPDIGYSFATGLRSILRQDPNIIMVGEIRDPETALLATQAALTGHLVLSTLHTNEASSALPRLINMGVEPFLITSSINAVIAQRLVRKICEKCQQEVKLPKAAEAEIEKVVQAMPKGTLESLNIKRPFTFRKGAGCEQCDKGYKGRVGVFEVLIMSSAIEELAIKRRPASEIEEQAKKEGMLTMREDGILKVLQGITTYEEILRVISRRIE